MPLGRALRPLSSLFTAWNRTRHCTPFRNSFRRLSRGSQRGGFQKSGFGGCSPAPKSGTRVPSDVPRYQNQNEGTCGCSPVPKTGTRAHSPKPPFCFLSTIQNWFHGSSRGLLFGTFCPTPRPVFGYLIKVGLGGFSLFFLLLVSLFGEPPHRQNIRKCWSGPSAEMFRGVFGGFCQGFPPTKMRRKNHATTSAEEYPATQILKKIRKNLF